MKTFVPAALAGIALACATRDATAVPQEHKPVVDSVSAGIDYDPRTAPPGAVLLVKGRNFGAKPDDLVATLDGAKLFVVEVTAESARVILPSDARLGRHELGLAAGGHRTTTRLEIVPRKLGRPDGEITSAPVTVVPVLRPARLVIATDPPSITLEGGSDLPPGFEVQATLGFKLPRGIETVETPIETCSLVVGPGGKLEQRFGPWPGKRLLAGEYFVALRFELALQSQHRLVKARWPKVLTPEQRARFELATARAYQKALTDEDRARQEGAAKIHFRDLATRAAALGALIEKAHVAAGKTYFPLGTTIDRGRWAEWAEARGLAKDEVTKLETDLRFTSESGRVFDPAKWLAWAREKVLAQLDELDSQRKTYEGQFVGLRDPNASEDARVLLDLVRDLVRTASRDLHDRAKVPLPDLLAGARASKGVGHLRTLERRLLERFPE